MFFRFITLLASIDPLLIEITLGEKPPAGFPLDKAGNIICAKCNTKNGCTRPLLDNKNINLKQQLYDDNIYSGDDINLLRTWIVNSINSQKCVWGQHTPIRKEESVIFTSWFQKYENNGFQEYDNRKHIIFLLREYLIFNCKNAYDMQYYPEKYRNEEILRQSNRLENIKFVYEELSGENFVFEVFCTRDDVLCNNKVSIFYEAYFMIFVLFLKL